MATKFYIVVSLAFLAASCSNGGGYQPPPAPPDHGKTVLCDSGTGTLSGSVAVRNTVTTHTLPYVIAPQTSASEVCGIINTLATDPSIGFVTDYASSSATGVDIYSKNATDVAVEFQNVTLQVQNF